jgi:glyoxylase-like metal-dependent hydrolase (beta-lactamase superfamily II)
MTVSQIHPRVFQVAAPFENGGLVNCYLIDAPKRALIDTGTSSVPQRSILPALAELGWQPSELRVIVNTHVHIDHAGGNAELQEVSGAGIHVHRADWELTDRDKHVEKYLRDELRLMGNEHALPEREALMRQQLGREWGIERALEDGDTIDLGRDVRLQVVHTPGHTPGSASYYWESEGLLFSGDAVNGRGSRPNGYPLYFSARDYAASLRRLLDLEPPIAVLAQAHRYRWSGPEPAAVRAGPAVRRTLEDSLAAWRAIEATVRAELARAPEAPFPELLWRVVQAVAPALGNEVPDRREVPGAAVNTVASHWREARGAV